MLVSYPDSTSRSTNDDTDSLMDGLGQWLCLGSSLRGAGDLPHIFAFCGVSQHFEEGISDKMAITAL
jgi:hypothetical protein